MTRLIPGKTKVQIELFRGVTLKDIVIGAVALTMIVFVLISSLPFKLVFCVAVAMIAALLLVRIDEQPNYMFLINIISHFGYNRRFHRLYSNEMLMNLSDEDGLDTVLRELFPKENKSKRELWAELKAMAKTFREDEKILKSKKAAEEEKEAIRTKRAKEWEEFRQKIGKGKKEKNARRSMDEIVGFTDIKENVIVFGDREYYGAVIELDPVEFRFFSEARRTASIEAGIGRVLRSVSTKYATNIVKLERPIQYESYLEREYDKLFELRRSYESAMLTEEELQSRVEVAYDRINQLRALCGKDKVVTSFYYLALFDSDRRMLETEVSNAMTTLLQRDLVAKRLENKDLAIFLKYSNSIDFDEHEIDRISPKHYAKWAKPETVDIKSRTVEVNHIVTHNLRVVNYPMMVGDAWLAGVMSYPGTKVVVKARPMDRNRSIRNIDHSLTELRGKLNTTGVDSKRIELEQHIQTLSELLATLQNDNESLMEVNIYVTAYDIVLTRKTPELEQVEESVLPTISDMKKGVRRAWQESNFRIANQEFSQVETFIATQISGLDPFAKQGRGIPSNTLAACYPWIYAHISDQGGILLGENDGVPVFLDFFRRDSERVNSNMVIVGKSGSGKSYATKTVLANLAADDAKIFVLDPENEYTELAANLHGKIINVGNAAYGRLNPFHIITALEDDEAGEDGPSGSYSTHLQFLEEFFRQILPDCDKDSMEYLNNLVDRLYGDFGITPETDLSRLTPEDYPIFDDLYDAILREFQNTDNQYLRTMLRTLMNYIAKFSTGGRNANIWNGPSTVTTDTNFTVFNFQSMLANRNTVVANAQMLLVLKFIDNEIIKNRDYNTKYKLDRKIVVVIDEAHVFIDTKFPIALDFMFQLAKRIRKYNGMQIVITQNIKDFVGSEEIARKSTAIINACQYSFIFSLAPNDIQDLVRLYANAGGINESEQEEIVQAPRGQAFTIMSPTSRSTFQIQTGASVKQLFEEREYTSRYFTGDAGSEAWEEFVADSRELHDASAFVAETADEEEDREETDSTLTVSFKETSGDEYDRIHEGEQAAPSEHGTVTLTEWSENKATLSPDAPAFPNKPTTSADAAIEKLAAVLTKSLQRNAEPGTIPAEGEIPTSGSYDEAFYRFQNTMEEQIRQERYQLSQEREELRREREELRSMLERLGREPIRNEEPPEPAEELPAAPKPSEPPQEVQPVQETPEEQDVFSDLELEFDFEPPVSTPEDTEPAEYTETDAFREKDVPEEDSGEDFGEDSGEDSDEDSDEDSEEDSDDDGSFDLEAFLSRSVARAQHMTVVDKMRRDGQKVAEITLEELAKFIEVNYQ